MKLDSELRNFVYGDSRNVGKIKQVIQNSIQKLPTHALYQEVFIVHQGALFGFSRLISATFKNEHAQWRLEQYFTPPAVLRYGGDVEPTVESFFKAISKGCTEFELISYLASHTNLKEFAKQSTSDSEIYFKPEGTKPKFIKECNFKIRDYYDSTTGRFDLNLFYQDVEHKLSNAQKAYPEENWSLIHHQPLENEVFLQAPQFNWELLNLNLEPENLENSNSY